MPVLDPYHVAARIGAKYQLTESQEQVLRATLAGLPDDVACRFENRRRALATIKEHRRQIFERMSWVDRACCLWIAVKERRRRRRDLRRSAEAEAETLQRIHQRGGR